MSTTKATTAPTAGPWKIEPVFIAQHNGPPLHFGEYRFPHESTADGCSRTYPREEAEANARLIAAAPDLSAFVRKICAETLCICGLKSIVAGTSLDQSELECTHCEALALIAKMEGKP